MRLVGKNYSRVFRFGSLNSSYIMFDLNNGLLLTANADALFDKFLITVDENKELVFSFEIDKNYLLKQQLMLDRPIFKLLLNDQRMEYMKWHREQFYKKEEERKK